ncbi:ankyrin [Formosa agariphila KMM 3901]|uniref:Ankyrin n=1 Tax=Formosa agariphila (strain DSM 15362 / KCTC 12365 / LMG 23005 / KMM 3901 / M-2Alg 35-1) TaxID=1347342 RepID=T2KIH4_FORAG|nr:ankyrin repeat domain-containing protein [Formosa agariphila]CDF78221.1 ankyrin [Formosa agariphila KMM 3901]
MKKLLFIIAIVFGATSTQVQASNFISNTNSNILTVEVNKPTVNLLCTSIAKGDLDIVKKLIANGESVNKKSNGQTPAMYAARYNRTEILELLIAEGANLRVKDNKGYSALDYAKATNAVGAQKLIEAALVK